MATRKAKPIVDTVINKMQQYLDEYKNSNQDACWLWQKTVINGYGKIHITVNGKLSHYGVHRVVMYMQTPNDNPEMCVIHSCDNPKCFNPKHLSWGTHLENMQDKVAKGRGPDYFAIAAKGDKHGTKTKPESISKGTDRHNAVLNADKVKAIRLSSEKYPILAKEYNVSVATICRVKTGVCWKHVC